MSSPVRVGDASPLVPHSGGRMTYPKYVTPAPGDYEVQSKHNIKFTKAPTSQFGGNLCKIDRDKTGLRARALQTADDPGPNAYSVTAAKQKLDVKQRAPTFKFGSSQRADGSKIYMHRADTTGDVTDPNRAAAGRGVPGPGAYGTMGPSMEKTKKSAPRFSFGLKPAIQETTSATTINIGPGTYLSPSSIGKQVISMRPTSPGFSMGTCDREKMGEVLQPGFSPNVKNPSPGPSKYESPSGVGKQLQPAPEFVKVVDNYRTQCEYLGLSIGLRTHTPLVPMTSLNASATGGCLGPVPMMQHQCLASNLTPSLQRMVVLSLALANGLILLRCPLRLPLSMAESSLRTLIGGDWAQSCYVLEAAALS